MLHKDRVNACLDVVLLQVYRDYKGNLIAELASFLIYLMVRRVVSCIDSYNEEKTKEQEEEK